MNPDDTKISSQTEAPTPSQAQQSSNQNDKQTKTSQSYFSRLFTGRLTRKSYFIGVLVLTMITILSSFLGVPSKEVFNDSPIVIPIFIQLLSYGVVLFYAFSLAVRRLHDLNHTGLLSLFLLMPFLPFIFGLYLLFAPGNDGDNQYGTRPHNQSFKQIFGFI